MVLFAVWFVGVVLLMGCGESPTVTDAGPSPQATAPDPSQLALAVNQGYRAEPSDASGSAYIVPASCVAGVVWQGTFYVIGASQLPGVPDPQPADPLDGVVIPGCNDTGGTDEPDLPTNAWEIDGVDPGQAIFVEHP